MSSWLHHGPGYFGISLEVATELHLLQLLTVEAAPLVEVALVVVVEVGPHDDAIALLGVRALR